ncbi:MAG TPA: hypothetical protein VN025_01200 [Candidatus Dormibacteraeota bacterium]|jgi:hypothetical protein|nr:hypothetical protein [Candidatus Dormibacteraeota bacterium]
MNKRTLCHSVAFALTLTVLIGCKSSLDRPEVVEAQTLDYGVPPVFNLGLSVEQAYEAIPHRRTVWNDVDSTATPSEKAYLKTIFEVLDEATAVRIAGMQNYANGHFEYTDPDSEYEQLVNFTRGMTPPKKLEAYHNDILQGLTNQRQFFTDWKAQGDRFGYPVCIKTHPGVQRASGALRSAYNELMVHFPAEAQANKDAFFDYHCALDFL